MHFEFLIAKILKVFKTRGIIAGFSFVKAVRGNVLNYLSGNPERIPGVKLRPSGLPAALGSLAELLEKGRVPHKGVQLLLTILYSTRALKGKPDPDISTIIEPSNRSVSDLEICRFSQDF